MINFINKLKTKLILVILVIITILSLFYFRQNHRLSFQGKHDLSNLPHLNETIKLGGFSGLFYDKTDKQGNIYLWTITDRGPNSNKFKKNKETFRIFPIADFKPRIIYLKLGTDKEIEIISNNEIEDLSGLPISKEKDSIPVDQNRNKIAFNLNGADTEGIIKDRNNNFWIVDEYYPSIIKLDNGLKLLKRFASINSEIANQNITNNLPEIFNNIKKNNGFESIAYDGNDRIYIFTQDHLKDDKNIKILVFNIKTEKSERIYNYLPEEKSMVSDIVFIKNNLFLSLEKTSNKHNISKLKIDLGNKSDKIRSKKILSIQDDNQFINSEYKMEGIAYDGKSKIFIINDNDFGIDEKNTRESFLLEYEFSRF